MWLGVAQQTFFVGADEELIARAQAASARVVPLAGAHAVLSLGMWAAGLLVGLVGVPLVLVLLVVSVMRASRENRDVG